MIVTPYESVGQIRFGQSRTECLEKLGPIESSFVNSIGLEELGFDRLIVRVSPADEKVVEFTLLPYLECEVCGIVVTWDAQFLDAICQLDGAPVDVYGFIVLRNLGIAVTGIHDADDSQLAITVFMHGAFDSLIGNAVLL